MSLTAHSVVDAPPRSPAEVVRLVVSGDGAGPTEQGVFAVEVPAPELWTEALDALVELGAIEVRLALGGEESVGATTEACQDLVPRGFEVLVEARVPGSQPVLVPAVAWLAARGEEPPTFPGAVPDAPPLPTAPLPLSARPRTDTGNAERLIEAFGADLRWSTVAERWLVWDGKRWAEDPGGEVARRAKATVRAMRAEAAALPEGEERTQLSRWAVASESRGRLSAMIDLARHEPGVAVAADSLDSSPWLLNVLNGTVDLRNGQLWPHERADLITRVAPVEYNPDATSEVWDRFLADATDGDDELASFLARLVGYSLTGSTEEEVMILVHGPSGSGKSSFIESVKAMLGPGYARTADFESLVHRPTSSGPRADIADLAGARLVASIEVDEGRRLASALVKSLTGSDTVRARRLYREAFEYVPQFCLWLVANYAPRISSADSGMWRRVLRVPFEHVVPAERRDPKVKAVLRDPALGGQAILAWAVQGCLDWHQGGGLRVPERVLMATAAYKAESDEFAGFLGAECVLDPKRWTPSSTLRSAYEGWCQDNGEEPVSAKAFGTELSSRGLSPVKRRMGGGEAVRGWVGIGLAEEA